MTVHNFKREFYRQKDLESVQGTVENSIFRKKKDLVKTRDMLMLNC